MDERLESPKQLATRAGISERQARALIRSGKIEHVKIGERIYVPEGAYGRFLEGLKNLPPPSPSPEPLKPWSPPPMPSSRAGAGAAASARAQASLARLMEAAKLQEKLAREPRPPRHCKICNSEFVATNFWKRCCSEECARQARRGRARAKYRAARNRAKAS